MNQQIIWKQINHPDILPGYLISPEGYIKSEGIDDKDAIKEPSYHSTNGYDFVLLNNKDGNLQLFPIDEIIAIAYVPIPESLKGKKVKVSHINGDTRDILLDNLQWVEDIEEWRWVCDKRIISNRYKVSNFGNILDTSKNIFINKHINGRGYYNVNLLRTSPNGGRNFITVALHCLIANAFLPNTACEFNVVNHIDGIKLNNIPKNLEHITTLKNTQHAMLTYLKDHISSEVITYIRVMLKKWKYPRLAYAHIDHEKYPEINMQLITNVKRNWYYDRGENKNIKYHPGKMTVDEIDMVRTILLDTEGHNCTKAYEKIDHNEYPHITLQMIKEIKTNKYSTYNRSKIYDLSKLKFMRTPTPCKLSISEIDSIRDLLMENNGHCKIVYSIAKQTIPQLSIHMIEDIKRGKSYKRTMKYDLSKSNRYPYIIK